MDGTYEYWSSSNNQWVLQSEKEYTYNANTKIMSYKSKKVRNGMSGSLLTQAEFLEWINGLPDNSEMFQTGKTRAQMCDYVNALYNAIGYCKCEEETYQGNLCYSSRDYYPQNTSLNAYEGVDAMYLSTSGLSIRIYPSAQALLSGKGSVYIGSTSYNITAITASTITAVYSGENNNNTITTITLNYTKSWSDGVITITVTGANTATQTALSNQSYTLSTPSSTYYQKQ